MEDDNLVEFDFDSETGKGQFVPAKPKDELEVLAEWIRSEHYHAGVAYHSWHDQIPAREIASEQAQYCWIRMRTLEEVYHKIRKLQASRESG